MNVFIKFSAKNNGSASAANIKYITRTPATGEDERALYLHNLDKYKGENYRETRSNLEAYAEMRLDDEQARQRRNPKENRTHYRVVLSFDRSEQTDKARELAAEWLKKNFPDARGVVSIHQDRQNTHAHVWIDARDIHDKKLLLDHKLYKNLDVEWAKIYAREYGDKYLKEHLEKKAETKVYKKAMREGRSDAEKPNRVNHDKTEYKRRREEINYGIKKERLGEDKRVPSIREYVLEGRKRDIEQVDKAIRSYNDTIRETTKLRAELDDTRGTNERGNRDLSQSVGIAKDIHSRGKELVRDVDKPTKGVEKDADRSR